MKNLSILSTLITAVLLQFSTSSAAQTYSFDGRTKQAIQVKPTDKYSDEKGYGFDYEYIIDAARKQQTESFRLSDGIFYFSVAVPDGNYKVTVTVGSKKKAASTTVRAESRRLYVSDAKTKKGEFKTFSFIVNKHNTDIVLPDGKTDLVKITPREKGVIRWDDKLTLEINGDSPACSSIKIEPADDVPTMYLCGNSTVVDQDYEPWASWGQMFTYWFNDQVAVSNYAASGLTSTSFAAQNRLKKIVSLLKPGDYVFIEFGHNDEKDKMVGAGAFYNYTYNLKTYIDQIRAKGATPIICSPTERRMVKDGKFSPTHGKYPEAAKFVADDQKVGFIDLTSMSQTLYKAMGAEGSKHLLVHYPAHTYPGQVKAFEDNTHFNAFGAYQISRLIVRGMKALDLPVLKFLKPDFKDLDPANPEDRKTFHWSDSPFIDTVKPDGN